MSTTQTIPPTAPELEDAARQAEASGEALRRLLPDNVQSACKDSVRLTVQRPDGAVANLIVPVTTLSLLSRILEEIGRGKRVTLFTTDQELTTSQAAAVLNVSRPYLVKLLEDGKVAYRLVGPRRRVLLVDLIRYKQREEEVRHQGLDELAAEGQKLHLT